GRGSGRRTRYTPGPIRGVGRRRRLRDAGQDVMTITETAPQATDHAEPPRSARRLPYRLVLGVGGLAAAWIVPVLTNLAHLDVILPVLLVLAVMSLLRSGRTIIDRFVLALALLFGITCLAGMVLSVWPWGLSPVPTAG